VAGHQMPLEHLELQAILEAHDMIGLHRRAHRHSRLGGFIHGGNGTETGQRAVDVADQRGDLIDLDGVIADVRGATISEVCVIRLSPSVSSAAISDLLFRRPHSGRAHENMDVLVKFPWSADGATLFWQCQRAAPPTPKQ
jgi:hypothetical protein